MRAINDHISSINLAFQELMKGKFWLYLLPSLLISLFFWFVSGVLDSIFGFLNHTDSVPFIGNYLETGIQSGKSFFSYLGDLFHEFMILTALSPVYCLLSEKVDNTVTGAKFNGGIIRILTDLLRAVFIVFISMILYIALMATWWIFSWLSGFHLLDELIYFFIAAFFLGFSFYDYSLERYHVSILKSWGFGFNHILYMILTGGIFHLMFQVPYLGILFAPFFTSIISTIVYLKMQHKISIENQVL